MPLDGDSVATDRLLMTVVITATSAVRHDLATSSLLRDHM